MKYKIATKTNTPAYVQGLEIPQAVTFLGFFIHRPYLENSKTDYVVSEVSTGDAVYRWSGTRKHCIAQFIDTLTANPGLFELAVSKRLGEDEAVVTVQKSLF